MLRGLRDLLARPTAPVVAHAVDDRQQVEPLLGQRVLDARGHLGGGVALDDAVLLQRAQPQRERGRADAGERALQLAEAAAPGGQVAHQQQRPLAADQLGGVTNGTDIGRHRPTLYQLKRQLTSVSGAGGGGGSAGAVGCSGVTSAIVVPRRPSESSRSLKSWGLEAHRSASSTVTRPATTCA